MPLENKSPTEGAEFGHALDFAVIEKGLRELNPDISLDAVVRRPGDYSPILQGQPIDYSTTRSGVYYNGHFVVSIDRGLIPEFKMWSVQDGFDTISMADIEKFEDTKVMYIQILPSDPFYHAALFKADQGHDNYEVQGDGKLFRYEAFRLTKVKDKVIRVGWRHTFEHLIRKGIHGITRDSLAGKFGVDMNKFPLGTPEQIAEE